MHVCPTHQLPLPLPAGDGEAIVDASIALLHITCQ
jgi:hypothetical protein